MNKFEKYIADVGAYLKKRYGLELEDLDDQAILSAFNNKESATDFIDRIGEKYDLTPMDEITLDYIFLGKKK